MPPSPMFLDIVTKSYTGRPHQGRALAVNELQKRQGTPRAPVSRKPVTTPKPAPAKLDAAALIARTERRLRRQEYMDVVLTAKPVPAAPKTAKAAKSAVLPPPPIQTRHPRFDGPHQHRAGIEQFSKYLRCAEAIRSLRSLNADEQHHVDVAQARLAELRQFAGMWGG